MMGIKEGIELRLLTVDSQGVLVKSLEPILKKSTSCASSSLMTAAAGVSTMMPTSISLS